MNGRDVSKHHGERRPPVPTKDGLAGSGQGHLILTRIRRLCRLMSHPSRA